MAEPVDRADVLLLNASNYPGLPIYPYAFVQVSAVARRYGHSVRRVDLLHVDRSQWPDFLADVVHSTAPKVIGLHLRQADSLYIWDYVEPDTPGMPSSPGRDYFPVDDTRYLVDVLRSLTNTPIVIGGFGFTTHARRLVELLRPDFAILGEPDPFFRDLDAILSGTDTGSVDNLVRPSGEGYSFGPRVLYDPADEPEYTQDVFDDLVAFYGEPGVFDPDGPHVPVELARGCPYRCYFCTEPVVKGRKQRVRDLDVVLRDVRFLGERGVRRVWMICSEANVGSNSLLLELADRMAEFNRDNDTPMDWSAYFLPNPELGRDEMRRLLDSGFSPGWNQFMSFDDGNLKQTKVPYRARHAVRAQVDWASEVDRFQERTGRPRGGHRLDMFLGNAFADATTVANTLARLDEAGLADQHDSGLITRATRVFDLGNGPIGDAADTMFSIGPRGRLSDPDLLYPTFHYSPDLVRVLGSTREVDRLFSYLEDTFLSRAHRSRKDWRTFLRSAVPAETLAEWCAGAAEVLRGFRLEGGNGLAERVRALSARSCGPRGLDTIGQVYESATVDDVPSGALAYVLTELAVEVGSSDYEELLDFLGFPYDLETSPQWTEYRMLKQLFTSFATRHEALTSVRERFGPTRHPRMSFLLRYFLFRHNLLLRPDYREVLFHGVLDPLPTGT